MATAVPDLVLGPERSGLDVDIEAAGKLARAEARGAIEAKGEVDDALEVALQCVSRQHGIVEDLHAPGDRGGAGVGVSLGRTQCDQQITAAGQVDWLAGRVGEDLRDIPGGRVPGARGAGSTRLRRGRVR